MSLPTNRQPDDLIEAADINQIAEAVNQLSDGGTSEPQSVAASLDPADPKKLTLLLTIPSQPSVALTLTKEGYKVTASWVGSSPDGLSLTYKIDWGDGSAPAVATSPATKTYPSTLADYTITVTVTDSEGTTATDSKTVTVSPPGVSAYGAAVLADSPVVYYPMGDAALPIVDYMGNSTATTTGVLENVDMGDTARSLKLTNTNSMVNLGQPAVLNDLAQFTFECLIRTNIPDEQGEILYRGYVPSGSFVEGIQLKWSKNVGISWTRRRQGDPKVTSLTLDFTTNDRLHVAGIYDATTGLKLYVNGVLQGENTGAWGTLPAAGTADWLIGQNGLYSNVAGVAFYNKVLTANRIQAHAAAAGL